MERPLPSRFRLPGRVTARSFSVAVDTLEAAAATRGATACGGALAAVPQHAFTGGPDPGLSMTSVRLILEPHPSTGAWNMALDESLLESAVGRGRSTVRIYRWCEPTVSLGYFQDVAALAADSRYAGLAAVRRLSGGGAILHHLEITYSLCLPPSHPWTAEPTRLYSVVHSALIDVLAQFGVRARMRGTGIPSGEAAPSLASTLEVGIPDVQFLCFGRGDPNDVVIGPHKVIGSAQRRRRGAILQHGSILLSRSPHAPEFPGICDLADAWLDSAPFGSCVGRAIVAALGAEAAVTGEIDADELRRAELLERERYRTLRWQSASSSV